MIIKYIDKHGNSMQMESPEEEIVLPVLCKEYNGIQHSLVMTIDPGISEYRQIQKVTRKQKEGFNFVWMEMVLNGDARDMFNWELIGEERLEGEAYDLMKAQWLSRREAWHKQHCSYWGLTSMQQNCCNMGDTFYLTDSMVADVKNCVIHLFGECKIWTSTLSNVLLFIHDQYEEL